MAGNAVVNLNRLAIFVCVVETGTLTAAARRLALTKTMVSTHIQRLEAEVGASLLVRTTRRLSLTDAGRAFFEASRRIVQDADEAISIAGRDAREPRGILRVTAPVDYGAAMIGPVLAELAIEYAGLKIDLITDDRIRDLVCDGIDVAIRIGKLADSSYRATRIGGFTDWLVASPGYLGARAPSAPRELADLRFVALSVLAQPSSWVFMADDERREALRWEPALSANTALAVRAIALAGGGLAILPDYAVADLVASGHLLRVLPDWHLPTGGIYAVYPPARQHSEKIRVFIEKLRLRVDKRRGRRVGRICETDGTRNRGRDIGLRPDGGGIGMVATSADAP